MQNQSNTAASSHADAAATSANEKGFFNFSFPDSKESTAIPYTLAASLSYREKKKIAYEWLVNYVLPFYVKEKAIPFKDTYFFKHFFEVNERQKLELEKMAERKKLEMEKAAVLRRIDQQNKKILFFTTYGTFMN